MVTLHALPLRISHQPAATPLLGVMAAVIGRSLAFGLIPRPFQLVLFEGTSDPPRRAFALQSRKGYNCSPAGLV